MKDRFEVRCKVCQRFLGELPFRTLWTGAVWEIPLDEIQGSSPDQDLYPEDEPANVYLPCEQCKKAKPKRPHWMRFEEIPEKAPFEIRVPVILPNADAA